MNIEWIAWINIAHRATITDAAALAKPEVYGTMAHAFPDYDLPTDPPIALCGIPMPKPGRYLTMLLDQPRGRCRWCVWSSKEIEKASGSEPDAPKSEA